MLYKFMCSHCEGVFFKDKNNFALKIKIGLPAYVRCSLCKESNVAYRIRK